MIKLNFSCIGTRKNLVFCIPHSSSATSRVPHAEIHGTKYSRGDVLLCTFCQDEPVFGKVLDFIVTSSSECFFILKPFITRNFNCHYNAYEVEQIPNEYVVCQQKDHHVLSISKSFSYSLCNKNFVCIKYHVCL